MTIPKFQTIEEADRWLAGQAKAADIDRIEQEVRLLKGQRWVPRKARGVLTSYAIKYTTVRTSTGKFGVAAWNNGRLIYAREFRLRKDAKDRASKLYWERDKR